jgi:Ser/Thr protein kinase RdoA (MazF antagonist)
MDLGPPLRGAPVAAAGRRPGPGPGRAARPRPPVPPAAGLYPAEAEHRAADLGRHPEAARLARQRIDPATRRLLGEVADRVQAVLAELGSGPQAYGLVHADLHLGNVLDHRGQARPLDFDDASWGHYALDLAVAVDSVPEPLHPVLLDGYRAVRPLPAGYQEHTEALLAGRRLFLATFLLAHGLPAGAHLDLLQAFTAR